jgi:hypothetical protein
MNISFCTLFEGNYHFGVAALSNSLIAAGYAGTLWVGYRGALSGWIVDSPSFNRASGEFQVARALKLCMLEFDTPPALHLVQAHLHEEGAAGVGTRNDHRRLHRLRHSREMRLAIFRRLVRRGRHLAGRGRELELPGPASQAPAVEALLRAARRSAATHGLLPFACDRSVKPWHGGHIRQALHGRPPSFASKWYSRFANAPIRVYLDGALARRQLSLKIAAAIGHVFKRA